MSYSYSNNNLFYPTIFGPGDFNLHHYLSLSSSTGAAREPRMDDTFANGWGRIDQPVPIVSPSTSVPVPTAYDLAVANSNLPQIYGYTHPAYTNQYNPEPQYPPYFGQYFHLPDVQDQFEPTGLPNWDGSRLTTALKAPAVVPAPSSATLAHYSSNFRSEPILFDYTDAHASRTHIIEQVNAEARPSTLPPPRVSSVDPPTQQPSGGISETTAYAANIQTTKEEHQAPRSKRSRRTKAPRASGTKKPRRHRVQLGVGAPRLRNWARRYTGDLAPPPLADALAIATEFIPTIRRVVNPKPCLLVAKTKEGGTVSEAAMRERGRREIERNNLLTLSRYYPRVKGEWSRGDLITKVVEDLEGPLTESE